MNEEQVGGLLFVLSGPSGVGKDAAIARMKDLDFDIHYTITATTRKPRENEVNGIHYFFYAPDTFAEMVGRGEFLESAAVYGKLYGSPRQQVREQLARGSDVLLKIDVQGARQVKAKLPEAVAIFIVPPSRADLERRLRSRGQDSSEAIERRLERARQEIACSSEYDFVVVNDDLERAGREVCAIAIAIRCRRKDNDDRLDQILETFGG